MVLSANDYTSSCLPRARHCCDIYVNGIFPQTIHKVPRSFCLRVSALPERQLPALPFSLPPLLNIFRVFWLMEKSFLFPSPSLCWQQAWRRRRASTDSTPPLDRISTDPRVQWFPYLISSRLRICLQKLCFSSVYPMSSIVAMTLDAPKIIAFLSP